MSRPTVLVADRSPLMRRIIRELLTGLGGVDVVEAIDGFDAVKLLVEGGFRVDLMLIDWPMPRLRGVELARMIKSHERLKALPLVMLVSPGYAARLAEAAAASVDGYLLKPFTREMLYGRIAALGERGPALLPGAHDTEVVTGRTGVLPRLGTALATQLERLSTTVDLSDGEEVFAVDKPVQELVVVLEGNVVSDGAAPYLAGEAVATAELLTGDPLDAPCVAKGGARVLRLDRQQLESMVRSKPALGVQLCRAWVERARRLDRATDGFGSLTELIQALHLQQRSASVELPAVGGRLELMLGELVIARHPQVADADGLRALDRLVAEVTGPLAAGAYRLGSLSSGSALNIDVRTAPLLRRMLLPEA